MTGQLAPFLGPNVRSPDAALAWRNVCVAHCAGHCAVAPGVAGILRARPTQAAPTRVTVKAAGIPSQVACRLGPLFLLPAVRVLIWLPPRVSVIRSKGPVSGSTRLPLALRYSAPTCSNWWMSPT